MLKDFLLHIRYPYTTGVIATIWLGTAMLGVLGSDSSISNMLVLNIIATTLIALIGFSSPRR